MDVDIYSSSAQPLSDQPFEYVERKGLGHPDSICDSVMEAAAEALRQEYRRTSGRVYHHNLDKALLVAGQSLPTIGGGRIVSPMQIIAGDRAVTEIDGKQIAVDEIVESTVRNWFRSNLRFVDPDRHVAFRSELKPGSVELIGIFERDVVIANDTSAAVGYAPLTETERLVLAVERYMNSAEFKRRFPVAGEDVKVMAIRHQQQIRLTVATAFVDRFVNSEAHYFDQKAAILDDIQRYSQKGLEQTVVDTVELNTLDDRTRGTAGMYLTVVGTSAESGDGGEVGRGNSVNGLISLNRPTSNEAAAGKNTTCHVGNIYNHLSHRIASDIVESLAPVQEAYVWLCSQIGKPVNAPWSTSVSLTLDPAIDVGDVSPEVEAIIARQLARLASAP